MTKANFKKILFTVVPTILAIASFIIASGADNQAG